MCRLRCGDGNLSDVTYTYYIHIIWCVRHGTLPGVYTSSSRLLGRVLLLSSSKGGSVELERKWCYLIMFTILMISSCHVLIPLPHGHSWKGRLHSRRPDLQQLPSIHSPHILNMTNHAAILEAISFICKICRINLHDPFPFGGEWS